jgi:uncharacterized protein involved in tolerance to divalent cations
MVTVYISLEDQDKAKQIAEALLTEKLVVEIRIDYNNHVFNLIDGEIKEKITCVLTMQTKGMLFNDVMSYVQSRFGEDIPVYSVPITQGNVSLSNQIRNHTKQV